MASAQGLCTNITGCDLARRARVLDVPAGAPLLCPYCGQPLEPTPVPSALRPLIFCGVLAVVVLGGGILMAAWLNPRHLNALVPPPWLAPKKPAPQAVAPPSVRPPKAPTVAMQAPSPAAPVQPPKPAIMAPPAPVPVRRVVLRLAAADATAAALAPPLAQGFLQETGAGDAMPRPGSGPGETLVVAGSGVAVAIETGNPGAADITLAAGLAPAATGSAAIPVGLEGMAVIVHPSRSLAALSLVQLRALCAGTVTDWTALGSGRGPIHVYVPGVGDPVFGLFATLQPADRLLPAAAQRIEGSAALAARVADDPNAIGIVPLADIGAARAVPIGGPGAEAVAPERFNVATEDYPLVSRVLLYEPHEGAGPGRDFAAFALSPRGQDAVARAGFVPLTIVTQPVTISPAAPTLYRALLTGAERLSVDFRFRPNTPVLDDRGVADVDRLAAWIAATHMPAARIVLAGFAEDRGGAGHSRDVSMWRVGTVASALLRRGVKVEHTAWFGAALPVPADGDDAAVRDRRVEVYVKSAAAPVAPQRGRGHAAAHS